MDSKNQIPTYLYIVILGVFWSLSVAMLAAWKINHNAETTYELAENQARANFNKDKAFRLWMTEHGRIYIPVGDKYQPDPYLSHIEDRDITTPSGIELSMINPARMVRELDEEFSSLYGVSGRVISLTPIRPGNAPDEWEKSALLKLDQGIQEVFEYTKIEGEPYLRLMQPLPIKKGCLLCHAHMATKTNGIGGGVTISLPLKELLARQDRQDTKDIQQYFIVWLIGMLGLLVTYLQINRQAREKELVVGALISSQTRNKAIMESALDCIITIDQRSVVVDVNPATEKTFGYERGDMIGQDLAGLIIPPELRERHHAGMKKLLTTGETSILNTRIETMAQHAKGHQMLVELAITRIDDEYGTFFTAYMRDLTEAHELKKELTYQARHDALTGLVNRHAFEEHAKRTFKESEEGVQHCLLYLDLDQFKIVNDSCGHVAGDALLQQISQMLQTKKRASDTLARLGGDEFALLLEGCPLDKAMEIAGDLIDAVQHFRFYWEDKAFSIGVSIGLVPVQGRFIDFTELLSAADAACYKAKDEGRSRFHIYTHDDVELSRQRGEVDWVTRIQQAIEEDRFILYRQVIQPIGELVETGKLHCEVLLRMKSPDGEIITPDQFIPAAERYNLMLAIDKWVIDNTFHWMSQQGDRLDHINVLSINLSGLSMTDASLSAFIHEKLLEYDLPPEIICFEITETVAITNLIKATRFLDEVHKMGCMFSLDDFGSGVSSFGYLKDLPVDFLKIDGEFVKDITTNPINRAMVKSINEIGQVMGKFTIAEYVEDQQTVDMLTEIGVDYAQGFYFSRPEPLD